MNEKLFFFFGKLFLSIEKNLTIVYYILISIVFLSILLIFSMNLFPKIIIFGIQVILFTFFIITALKIQQDILLIKYLSNNFLINQNFSYCLNRIYFIEIWIFYVKFCTIFLLLFNLIVIYINSMWTTLWSKGRRFLSYNK